MWRTARNCSITRATAIREERRVAQEPFTFSDQQATQCFMFCGCPHAESFSPLIDHGTLRLKRVFARTECEEFEAAWNAHAEKLFAEYTARWTEPQRVSFRARLWPVPFQAPQAELFDRNNDEAPVIEPEPEMVEAHPFEE